MIDGAPVVSFSSTAASSNRYLCANEPRRRTRELWDFFIRSVNTHPDPGRGIGAQSKVSRGPTERRAREHVTPATINLLHVVHERDADRLRCACVEQSEDRWVPFARKLRNAPKPASRSKRIIMSQPSVIRRFSARDGRLANPDLEPADVHRRPAFPIARTAVAHPVPQVRQQLLSLEETLAGPCKTP